MLKYLALYVFRVAISDNRILECTDDSVTYRYTPSGTKTTKTRTFDGMKFVQGFFQHALPKSFLKVRYHGWMASNSRTTREGVVLSEQIVIEELNAVRLVWNDGNYTTLVT